MPRVAWAHTDPPLLPVLQPRRLAEVCAADGACPPAADNKIPHALACGFRHPAVRRAG